MLCLLSGCGGGESPQVAAPPAPAPVPTPLVAGNGNAAALSALAVTSGSPAAQSEVQSGYLLTRVLVLLSPDATVDQLNAAGASVGATQIVTSMPGAPMITLAVPRQSDPAALNALVRQLAARPGISAAFPGREGVATVLPAQASGNPVPTEELSHLLPTRFPQAWNAQNMSGAACQARQVLVWDRWGDPGSRPDFLSQIDSSRFNPSNVGSALDGHGYDVALALAARFDAAAPTGAWPFQSCLSLTPLEVAGLDYWSSTALAVIAIGQLPPGNTILNVSWKFPEPLCGAQRNQACTDANIGTLAIDEIRDEIESRIAAATLITSQRQALVLSQFLEPLVTASAGNLEPQDYFAQNYPGFRDSRFTNVMALAAHMTEMEALLQDPALWVSTDPALPDLTWSAADAAAFIGQLTGASSQYFQPLSNFGSDHVLVVDSASASGAASTFNFSGANARAVGEDVLVSATTRVSGTSFAAPQVAGLAAYLWSLSPDLAAAPISETTALIRRTGRVGADGVPLIDAFAAALALDDAGGPGTIRRALLDANSDGVFDHLDLQLFADAYGLANPNTPTIPAAPDYSRFDLNGDGVTGGIVIAPFDLDFGPLDQNGQPMLQSVPTAVEGYEVPFNEAALSDLQVLCYYAYASVNNDPARPIFYATSASPDLRTEILGPDHCVGARLNVQAPGTITTSAPIDVEVSLPQNGSYVPAPNLLVEFVPTCGTVSPTNATSDAQGHATSTVTLDAGCPSVSVEITARGAPGGPSLATQTVSLRTPTVPQAGFRTTNSTVSILHSVTPLVADVPFSLNCGEVRSQVEEFGLPYVVTATLEGSGAPCVPNGTTYQGPVGTVRLTLHLEAPQGGQNTVLRAFTQIHLDPVSIGTGPVLYDITISDNTNIVGGAVPRVYIAGASGNYCTGADRSPYMWPGFRCAASPMDTLQRAAAPMAGVSFDVLAEVWVQSSAVTSVSMDLVVTLTPL